MTNYFMDPHAGVSWVEVQSSNHGDPVIKD